MIGVLALQGAFREHIEILAEMGVTAVEVKNRNDFSQVDALIIPGGESTVMAKLMERNDLDQEIILKAKQGMPIYAVCAGVILLAKEVRNDTPKLQLMNIIVERNAYGSQRESFESEIKWGDSMLHGMFIRAPKIISVDDNVDIFAMHDKNIVLARQNNFLVSTFHPELTDSRMVHEYFLRMVKDAKLITVNQ